MQSSEPNPHKVWLGISAGPTFREGVLEAMAQAGASRVSLGIVSNLLSEVQESQESVHALKRLTEGNRWQNTTVVASGFSGLPVGLAASLGKSKSLAVLMEHGAAMRWPEAAPLSRDGLPLGRCVSVLVEATLGAVMLPSLHGSRLDCLEMLANAGLDPLEPDPVTGRTAPETFLLQVGGLGSDAWADCHHTPTHQPWVAVWERWLKASPELARKVSGLEMFDWSGQWSKLSPEQACWVTLRDANLLPSLLPHARASLAMEKKKALEERWDSAPEGRRPSSRL